MHKKTYVTEEHKIFISVGDFIVLFIRRYLVPNWLKYVFYMSRAIISFAYLNALVILEQ